ncbi:SLAC1 anion channel family protein [Lichenihabitans sp. PAMC28606]|uniref:SLAC1 anion channel family protein n=1 Tax=Lichenihabitans sp. PAMC28606 TaxID=2880932 RepID=UPI001D0A4271|nr:SLAC1 anion channel family protein [Lichenihabitans sp. PAMC28606]UDL94312.1 SLAC1 anion channel family protein [Lichenihabitans sp. PAMC28606]
MSEAQTILPPGAPLLDYLPVGLFGSVMGLTGLSIAWRLAHTHFGAPEWIALTIAAVAIVAFVVVAIAYLVKLVTAFAVVRTEFRHPIAGNLFGTVLISLLLLPIPLNPFAHQLAQGLWMVGAVGMVLFAVLIVSRWMSDRQQVAHATPAWIIPVVGLLDVPLAIPTLDLPPLHGLMVFSLAVGLFFAVPLFTLVFSRLLFEPPLPDPLKPSLLILVAPFAVGYSTYTVTVGQTDLFSEVLYMLTLFMLAVLLGQLRNLPVCCPFRVSWWAVSFPLAASSIAALRFAVSEPGLITDGIAIALLGLATLVIIGLLGRTLFGVVTGELRTLSS